jgi:DNA invertase Pin-like site-specific DNA recombinase
VATSWSKIRKRQGFDTDQSNPTARFLVQLSSAVAEFERELISERAKSGMACARKTGRHHYLLAPDKAQRAAERRQQGVSIRAIAKALDLSHGCAQRPGAGLNDKSRATRMSPALNSPAPRY